MQLGERSLLQVVREPFFYLTYQLHPQILDKGSRFYGILSVTFGQVGDYCSIARILRIGPIFILKNPLLIQPNMKGGTDHKIEQRVSC